MNSNKICLRLKARINYICKIFNHSLIQSFIPFLEFPECPHPYTDTPKHTEMPTPDTNFDPQDDETPPAFFKNWGQMYAIVLILHAIIITLFYIFTHAYS